MKKWKTKKYSRKMILGITALGCNLLMIDGISTAYAAQEFSTYITGNADVDSEYTANIQVSMFFLMILLFLLLLNRQAVGAEFIMGLLPTMTVI